MAGSREFVPNVPRSNLTTGTIDRGRPVTWPTLDSMLYTSCRPVERGPRSQRQNAGAVPTLFYPPVFVNAPPPETPAAADFDP